MSQQPEVNEVVAERVARRVFESLGNHSEIHITETELVTIIKSGCDLADYAVRACYEQRIASAPPVEG